MHVSSLRFDTRSHHCLELSFNQPAQALLSCGDVVMYFCVALQHISIRKWRARANAHL